MYHAEWSLGGRSRGEKTKKRNRKGVEKEEEKRRIGRASFSTVRLPASVAGWRRCGDTIKRKREKKKENRKNHRHRRKLSTWKAIPFSAGRERFALGRERDGGGKTLSHVPFMEEEKKKDRPTFYYVGKFTVRPAASNRCLVKPPLTFLSFSPPSSLPRRSHVRHESILRPLNAESLPFEPHQMYSVGKNKTEIALRDVQFLLRWKVVTKAQSLRRSKLDTCNFND